MALELGLRYGGGDWLWFYTIPREAQIAVLAALEARQPRPGSTAKGEAFWLGEGAGRGR